MKLRVMRHRWMKMTLMKWKRNVKSGDESKKDINITLLTKIINKK